MVSDKFMVNSDAGRMAAARYAADNYAWHAGLDRHDTLRLNLLVEETLGMVKAMVNDFYGQLWFSGDDSACEIHLEATANMDSGRRQELISVSSSGKNAAAKGFMGMLGDVISGALHNMGRAVDTACSESAMSGNIIVPEGAGNPNLYDLTPVWTLDQYRANVEKGRLGSDVLEQAKQDLEKSIVANLADDIVVGVKGDRIELVITKRFKRDQK
ncbi:MAG: hypothetical protein IJI71_07920 [Clostridia bacterium]|nr:hypothetical protein [Clostridia bacterium]